MADVTFTCPDLDTFTGVDDLGLVITGQRLEIDRAVLACRVLEPDPWCRRCGSEGRVRDTVVRRLAHVPFGWRPTVLEITVRRYRCGACGKVWRQDTSRAAEPRAKLSRAALAWALEALVLYHLTVARVAEALAVAWDTANDAVQLEAVRMMTNHGMDSGAPFAALLVGQPTLRQRLRLGVLAALDQRIAVRYTLTGMTPDETSDYITHHVKIAGRTDTLFSNDAITLIHNASRGYPRAINNLAVNALMAAFAKDTNIVDEKAARIAISETGAD